MIKCEDMYVHVVYLFMCPCVGMHVWVRACGVLIQLFLNLILEKRLLLAICRRWGWQTLREKISDGIHTLTQIQHADTYIPVSLV